MVRGSAHQLHQRSVRHVALMSLLAGCAVQETPHNHPQIAQMDCMDNFDLEVTFRLCAHVRPACSCRQLLWGSLATAACGVVLQRSSLCA